MSEQAAPFPQVCAQRGTRAAAIFDVDGVLVASPRERAWREALAGYADSAGFTTEFYQANVAGKPRLDGARATVEGLGVAGAAARVPECARKKQALIDLLIAEGSFEAFPDAVRFADGLHAADLRLALGVLVEERGCHAAPPETARWSPGAVDLRRGSERHRRAVWQARSCTVPAGGDGSEGATDAVRGGRGRPGRHCRSARDGGMASVGIARLGDEALLQAARADLVVTSPQPDRYCRRPGWHIAHPT
jgi:beta-phosphoglucomutase